MYINKIYLLICSKIRNYDPNSNFLPILKRLFLKYVHISHQIKYGDYVR